MVPTAGGSSFPHLSLEIPKSTFLEMLFWNSIQSNCIQTTPKLYQLQCTFTHLKWTLLPEKPRWMWAQITSELLQEWVHHSSTKPEMHKTTFNSDPSPSIPCGQVSNTCSWEGIQSVVPYLTGYIYTSKPLQSLPIGYRSQSCCKICNKHTKKVTLGRWHPFSKTELVKLSSTLPCFNRACQCKSGVLMKERSIQCTQQETS